MRKLHFVILKPPMSTEAKAMNDNEVHPEARRILERYGGMNIPEIRRAGSEWVEVEHRANMCCPACGLPDLHVTYYEAAKGPQPNVLLEDGCCNACGHRYEHNVARVPNTGCNPLEWSPKVA